MKEKFLKVVLLRANDQLNATPHKDGKAAMGLWIASHSLLREIRLGKNAIEDQIQAHGEGRLKR